MEFGVILDQGISGSSLTTKTVSDLLGSFDDIIAERVGDDLVIGDENDISTTKALSLEEELGGIFVVNNNVEQLTSSNSFQGLDESGVVD